MIETSRSVVIAVDIDAVWDYVRDLRRWANLFPGCESCDLVDDDNSRWIIKVGAGGLVRTVEVLVRVERWDGPRRVDFAFQLGAEPVTGSGSYTAVANGDDTTEITLAVRVKGSGPLAPMWEAMSTPLLPQLAKTFGARLKATVEAEVIAAPAPAAAAAARPVPAPKPTPPAAVAPVSLLARLRRWLRRLLGSDSG